MIEYGCPHCGRRAFDAASVLPVRVEWKCQTHGKVDVIPRHATRKIPAMRELKCSTCSRVQYVERPKNDKTYCVVCGTTTLVIVSELGAVEMPGPRSQRRVGMHKRPTEAHARTR